MSQWRDRELMYQKPFYFVILDRYESIHSVDDRREIESIEPVSCTVCEIFGVCTQCEGRIEEHIYTRKELLN